MLDKRQAKGSGMRLRETEETRIEDRTMQVCGVIPHKRAERGSMQMRRCQGLKPSIEQPGPGHGIFCTTLRGKVTGRYGGLCIV